MLFRIPLSLANIPAHEIEARIRQFVEDVNTTKQFYEVVREEIFIDAPAFMMLSHLRSELIAVSLNGQENVGTIRGIPCRTNAFQPSQYRNLENMAPNSLEYRAFGE